MNKKGLMFTLEVLLSIIILAVAITVVLGENNSEKTVNTFVNFTNQSNRITSVYFNENPPSGNGDTIVCGDVWKYFPGTIIKSEICEGYP